MTVPSATPHKIDITGGGNAYQMHVRLFKESPTPPVGKRRHLSLEYYAAQLELRPLREP